VVYVQEQSSAVEHEPGTNDVDAMMTGSENTSDGDATKTVLSEGLVLL